MKDDIVNIINLEKITKVRTSLSMQSHLPPKNTLVKLIPLEYLKHGVKVLIDDKLFVAIIDRNLPLNEEIIAFVSDTNPFTLSLNLSAQMRNNEEFVVNSILNKLRLSGNSKIKNILPQIIKEEYYIIKSKLLLLDELLETIKVEGLEFSLLLSLLWSSSNNAKDMVKDLYDNLFDESFEQVCEQLFQSLKNMLFSEFPQYLVQKMANTLIYDEDNKNVMTLLNKTEAVFELIKNLNDKSIVNSSILESMIEGFTHLGSKYILQKSVLKDYDYFPDFVIVKRNTAMVLIHYSIKRTINESNENLYKIVFKNDLLPFNLKGIIREQFFDAEIKISEMDNTQNELNAFKENLFTRWGFRSELKVNVNGGEDYFLSKINSEVNKLIS